MEPFPSYGGAAFSPRSKKVIRLILKGCTNRPFFHISVQEYAKEPEEPVIEQIGNYDPLPNNYNEKLVAINFQRLEYWLRQGASVTDPVKKILGLSGYFPVSPLSMVDAFKRRKQLLNEIQKLKIEAAKFVAEDKPEEKAGESESVSNDETSKASTVRKPSQENSQDKDSKISLKS